MFMFLKITYVINNIYAKPRLFGKKARFWLVVSPAVLSDLYAPENHTTDVHTGLWTAWWFISAKRFLISSCGKHKCGSLVCCCVSHCNHLLCVMQDRTLCARFDWPLVKIRSSSVWECDVHDKHRVPWWITEQVFGILWEEISHYWVITVVLQTFVCVCACTGITSIFVGQMNKKKKKEQHHLSSSGWDVLKWNPGHISVTKCSLEIQFHMWFQQSGNITFPSRCFLTSGTACCWRLTLARRSETVTLFPVLWLLKLNQHPLVASSHYLAPHCSSWHSLIYFRSFICAGFV